MSQNRAFVFALAGASARQTAKRVGSCPELPPPSVKEEVAKLDAKLDATQADMRQELGELRAQSNWTAEAATRTGRMVAKMAQNGKTPAIEKRVEVEVVDASDARKKGPLTPSAS